jgi:hypothetical protein
VPSCRSACLAAAFAALTVAAALAPAARAADPPGYYAHATIAIQATTKKGQLAFNGDANFEQRGTTVRLDLVSLALATPGGPALPGIIPPGGYTIVYNPLAQSYTIWSQARRMYYSGNAKPAPTPAPGGTSAPAGAAPSPLPTRASTLEKLKDLKAFSLSIDLAPKETVDGHETTPFDFKLLEQGKSGEPFNLAGRVNFADDLAGVPILLVANATRGADGNVGNVRFALTQVRRSAPPPADFSPPDGYKQAASIFDVLVLPPGLGPSPGPAGGS